jgi:hypothetical protein
MSDPLPVPLSPDLLRVGDTERQQAVAALGEHYAAGRLDQDEYDTRVQSAYGSRTRVDLRGLFADLPEPAPFRPEPVPGWRDGRAARERGRSWSGPPVFPFLLVLAIVLSAVFRFPVLPIFLLTWFLVGRQVFGRRRWSVPSRA